MTYVPEIRTLADAPRYHAKHRPNDVALMYEGRETNYRDWDKRCTQVANGLIAVSASSRSRASPSSTRTRTTISTFCSAPRRQAPASSRSTGAWRRPKSLTS